LNISSIYPFNYTFQIEGKRKRCYSYLATAQQVRFAVTPVHTKDEFHIFHQAVSIGGEWNNPTVSPDLIKWLHGGLQRQWTSIFYKLQSIYPSLQNMAEHRQAGQTMVASLVQWKSK
jgi:hypothetical protein